MAEKATHPTSTYEVYCDHFDTKMKVEFHEANGEQKLKLSLLDEDLNPKELSLYREDVEALGKFLLSVSEHVQKR